MRARITLAFWVSSWLVSAAAAQTVSDPNLEITVIAAPGLEQPTGLRFLDADSMFVIEKATGRVKLVESGSATTVLDLPVNSVSERGLLGITLDPDFASNGHTYLYYSRSASDGAAWIENRLSRFTWNGSALVGETPLLSFPSDPAQNNGPNHDGGPLTFGPDGKLYGVIGDLNRNRAEQNNQSAAGISSGAGGIFRINPDGTIPSDNPLVGASNAAFHLWYATGVRNSFGLSFDPVTGALWNTENGPNLYDEINRVDPGFNSGWSKIMGPDSRDPEGVGDLVLLPGSHYSDPELSFLTPIAATSIQFLFGSNWGSAYDDAMLLGDFNTRDLYLLRLNAARDGFILPAGLDDLVADSTEERNLIRFGEDFGVITDIQVGPDNNVYVLSLSNREIYRIAVIPEASSLLLAAGGLAWLWMLGRRSPG